jgi:hypothetical protein
VTTIGRATWFVGRFRGLIMYLMYGTYQQPTGTGMLSCCMLLTCLLLMTEICRERRRRRRRRRAYVADLSSLAPSFPLSRVRSTNANVNRFTHIVAHLELVRSFVRSFVLVARVLYHRSLILILILILIQTRTNDLFRHVTQHLANLLHDSPHTGSTIQ